MNMLNKLAWRCYIGKVPKIVDPEQRRTAIADAALTVIARDGIEHATLARVAAEAGLVVGSVRHYIPTQARVIESAMDRLVERVTQRLHALGDARPQDARAADALAQLLPLDAARREEAAVGIALAAASRTRPELAPAADRLHTSTRALVRAVLRHGRETGRLLAEGADLDLETERLAALLDGLAHAAITTPDRADSALLTSVLDHHLAHLARTATS